MPEPTYYAKRLVKELGKRGIKAELEHYDGHKHIDIYIPEVNLEIEVDGRHHKENPLQALTDLLRTKYSMDEGRKTIRVPNELVYNYCSQTANIIEEMVNSLSKEPKSKVSKQKTISQSIPKERKNKFIIGVKEKALINLLRRKKEQRNKKIIKIIKLILIIALIGAVIWVFLPTDSKEEKFPNGSKEEKPPAKYLFYSDLDAGITAKEYHRYIEESHETYAGRELTTNSYTTLNYPPKNLSVKLYFSGAIYTYDGHGYRANDNSTLLKIELYINNVLIEEK